MDELDVARNWVREADGRVLFLLGAGASKPALPVSGELTEIVLKSIDQTIGEFAPESQVPRLWHDIHPVLRSATDLGSSYCVPRPSWPCQGAAVPALTANGSTTS